MKITCPKCAAQYQVDSSLIPPSGLMMRCQACLHSFPLRPQSPPAPTRPEDPPLLLLDEEFTPPGGVPAPPAPAPAPAGTATTAGTASTASTDRDMPALPPLGGPGAAVPPSRAGAETTDDAELPAPKRVPGRLGHAPRTLGDPGLGPLGRRSEAADLPAPKRASGPSSPPRPQAETTPGFDPLEVRVPPPPPSPPVVSSTPADLPAPVGPHPSGARGLDLVAPVGPHPSGTGGADLPAPVGPTSRRADLPAPVGPHPTGPRHTEPPAPRHADLAAPQHADLPAPVGPQLPAPAPRPADLPAPVGPTSRRADLPAPVGPHPTGPRGADLPAPVLADLPAPVFADLPAPVAAELPSPVAPDLPSPVAAGLPEPVHPGLVQPVLELEGAELPADPDEGLLAPRASSSSYDPAVAEELTRPIPPEEAAQQSRQSPGPPERQKGRKGKTGRKGEAAPRPPKAPRQPLSRRRLLALSGIAVFVLLLCCGGALLYLRTHRPAAAQELVTSAQRLLGDDLYASDKKAAEKLQQALQLHPDDPEARGLLVQAHLGAARAGAAAELEKADAELRKVEPSDRDAREIVKARALRELLAGQPDAARRTLEPLQPLQPLQHRRDAMAAVYLGWVELRAGKLPAAEQAFRAALAVDPRLPAAQLGLGRARQRQNDRQGALAAYGQVLAARPQHFAAALSQIEASEDPAAETKLLDVLGKLRAQAAPRELAEAYTVLGTQALAQSRRKDAEDRLRKALQADPGFVAAQVALARLLCDQDKAEEAVGLARKAVTADPMSLEAGLVLVRALLLGKKPLDAGAALASVQKLAPKDPRVLYWQGRREEEVAAPGSDEKAAQLYQKALEADPRYLDAYIALSRVLTRQGKATDALAALRQVAAQAADDPLLAAALGDAYLGMGESKKAEEALRMALGKRPDLLPVRMNLALSLEQQGRLEEAEREVAAVEERNKSYPGLSERRARLALRAGRYEDAEALYLKAAAEPGASSALRLDAAYVNMKSHPKEVEAILATIFKDDPRSPRGHTIFALMRLAQGEVGEAAMHADIATRTSDHPEAHLSKGLVLAQQGRRIDALQELALARRPPVAGRAMVAHARQLVAESQYGAALAEIEDFLARQKELLADRTVYRPEDVAELLGSAYLLQGDLLTMTQKEDRALRAYEQAAREQPRSGETAARFGKALYNAGRRGPAIRELSRALQLGGDQAPYALESYLLLGDSYREARQRAEALRAYHKWLDLAPPSAPERHEVESHILALGDGRSR